MANFATIVRTTLALYRSSAQEATRAFRRSAWLALAVPAYSILIGIGAATFLSVGMVGGFLLGLLTAACVSSFLALIQDSVSGAGISSADLGPSFGRHLNGVISVLFVFWIIQMLLTAIVGTNPGLAWLAVAIHFGLFILCNPLPELLYQSSRQGMALIDESVEFIRQNAIEWLLPVALLCLPMFTSGFERGLLRIASLSYRSALHAVMDTWLSPIANGGALGVIAAMFLAGALLVWLMLFRGFLFRSLNRSSRRQRLFEARARGL